MTVQYWDLACVVPIRALLDREPAVVRHIQGFLDGKTDQPFVDVVGPTDHYTRVEVSKRPDEEIPKGLTLPTIRLHFRTGKNETTGRKALHVYASQEDLDELLRWHRLYLFRDKINQGHIGG